MMKTDSKTARTTTRRPGRSSSAALDPSLRRRVVIEAVRPEIDCGRFPIKRTVGEQVIVLADVFADGHDTLAAVLHFRRAGDRHWQEVPMQPLPNDRWTARFRVEALGRYEYTVEGWVDRFGSWRHELATKVKAGMEVLSELLEGAALIRLTRERIQDGDKPGGEADVADATRFLDDRAATIEDTRLPAGDRIAAALAEDIERVMAGHADRSLATRYDRVLEVIVDRERARFGAWYEMFPRSAGTDPSRSATFDEAARRLPYVAAMGFDVLYLPPIHPIGRSFRKGRNNTLVPAPDDPGSPWAIGSVDGGHDAVDPGLGSIDDFDRFVESARRHRLEVALDLAYQVSPDHPYVRQHPEWFRHRPDGTIKYAENPPKKYQDIYPLNFDSEGWDPLWRELKRVIEFWIGHGVRIFRVDNPHTKPFRFWQWALDDIRRAHPDAIFLSEAFTRPKVMKHLAKAGFSQSYTYFTWRNSAAELREYFTELTGTEVREYMRPNLFANTPDILHAYLQRGGRPAFQVRLVLAATLGASYGIYSGFELLENVPVREGSEEYIDSEKYQIRVRDFDRPHSLAEMIGRVNAIRKAHPALHHDWGLRFHQTDNPELLCYSKRSTDGSDLLVMVVNVDPFNLQHGFVQLPLWTWGLPSGSDIEVHELLTEERYRWRGEWNYVRLDPRARVAHILHVQLPAGLPPESFENS
ncbi:MAG TPA: alpha-1,4-glucan--maltose-1-phosphate maltosyltransferase [Vicinamibacterales bacterium]|nr:alpha-1,4-glucan--maltose-1-phosphate maltosyltransferase [Vicinamibacterales bacterium]